MPFAPKIRKTLTNALEEHALPILKNQPITQLLAAPPFDLGHFETQIISENYLPDNAHNILEVKRSWPEFGLLATRGLRLEYIFSGTSHRKIGIRRNHAIANEKMGKAVPPAVQMLKIIAPATIFYADFCPRESAEY